MLGEEQTGLTTGTSREFTATHWSVVLAAGQGDSPQAAAALEQLCRSYWYPLYAYVRRRGHGPEEAQDLTQEFFARLLERKDLAKADPARGRFRSFLLGTLNHFLHDEWRKAQAAKRGGGHPLLSLDDTEGEERYGREPASEVTPESLYERRWALTLFDRALARLREEWSAAGKGKQFEAFRQFLANEAGEGEYGATAVELEMTPQAVAVAVHRLRQRYGDLVREEIAHTVSNADELEAELRHLLAVLSP